MPGRDERAGAQHRASRRINDPAGKDNRPLDGLLIQAGLRPEDACFLLPGRLSARRYLFGSATGSVGKGGCLRVGGGFFFN